MKLLKIYFDHIKMFENGEFNLDLYATDRVPASDESAFELARPLYANSVIALAGINASGKTTALHLVNLAYRILTGGRLNTSALPASLARIFDGETRCRCLIYHEGHVYAYDAQLDILHLHATVEGLNDTAEDIYDTVEDLFSGRPILRFSEETVSKAPASKLKKSMLSDWDSITEACEEVVRRSALDDFQTEFLRPDDSIIPSALKWRGQSDNITLAFEDEQLRLQSRIEGLDEILRVFDSRIEHLDVRDSGRAFELTFTGQRPLVLSREGLTEVLSSGTLRGVSLIQKAASALQVGGYLLVDEIENHLNRQLVNVIIDLFATRATNPNGATIVFTTHYPHILDHVHRKDNVFFLAHAESGSKVVKYSSEVKRIENKKSEVFASNFIKGTAPRYADVRSLRQAVGRAVAGVEWRN